MAKGLSLSMLAALLLALSVTPTTIRAAEAQQSQATFSLTGAPAAQPRPPAPTERPPVPDHVAGGRTTLLPATGESPTTGVTVLGLLIVGGVVGKQKQRKRHHAGLADQRLRRR